MKKLSAGRIRADKRHVLRSKIRRFLMAHADNYGLEIPVTQALLLVLETTAASYACHMSRHGAADFLENLSRRIRTEDIPF